jgi:hypothetical protein
LIDGYRFREFLQAKIAKRKKQIHPEHSARFNHLQLEIDCIEWALKKIEVNKISNDRLEGVIRAMIKDLEKRKDKAMKRSDTDDFVAEDIRNRYSHGEGGERNSIQLDIIRVKPIECLTIKIN